MPLHRIVSSSELDIEDIYATASANKRLPKYRITEHSAGLSV